MYPGSVIPDAIRDQVGEREASGGNNPGGRGWLHFGRVPDHQMSALLMAIFVRRTAYHETLALSHSGGRHSWPQGVVKHSTGRRSSNYPSDSPSISSRIRL